MALDLPSHLPKGKSAIHRQKTAKAIHETVKGESHTDDRIKLVDAFHKAQKATLSGRGSVAELSFF